MRILYGVVGEGMGHAMRSAVILERLANQGHDVRIVASGRAVGFLQARHPARVIPITGLTLAYKDNMVSKLRTVLQNLRAVTGVPDNVRKFLETCEAFAPHVVISDFESWSYWFARSLSIPSISVDNMQIINRCTLDEDLIDQNGRSFALAKNIVRGKLPKCNRYMITTFFYPPLRRDRTELHPPILRERIIAAKANAADGEHVLVYQTGTSHGALEETLSGTDASFLVYGLRRDLEEDVVEGNLRYRPFSEDGFVSDLASARAVVAGGGFTLMGEAIYLGKPVLSIPLKGQFEQILNATYLERLGYGLRRDRVDAEAITAFLDGCDRFRENLTRFEHDDNAGFFQALDARIAEAVEEGALPP